MSKERFSVFATDVETGESGRRRSTYAWRVRSAERRIIVYKHISRSPRVKVKVWLTNNFITAVQSKRGFVGVVTGLYTNERRRHTYAETD